MDTEDFKELLVLTVQGHPPLWDMSHKLYRDVAHKNKLWQEISHILAKPEHDVRKRWKSLRDRFMKEIKDKPPSGSGRPSKSEWYLLSTLSFLRDTLAPRRTIENLVSTSDAESSSTTQSPLTLVEEPSPFSPGGDCAELSEFNTDLTTLQTLTIPQPPSVDGASCTWSLSGSNDSVNVGIRMSPSGLPSPSANSTSSPALFNVHGTPIRFLSPIASGSQSVDLSSIIPPGEVSSLVKPQARRPFPAGCTDKPSTSGPTGTFNAPAPPSPFNVSRSPVTVRRKMSYILRQSQ